MLDSALELPGTGVEPIRVGTPQFRRANIAVFASGFGTFSMLWGVQALLPMLTRRFDLTPAESSLSLSLPTLALAACLIPAGRLSTRFGRKRIMVLSISSAALLTLACGLAGSFSQLLVLRLLTGMALAGIPAVTNVYIAEEVEASSVTYAFGLAMAGNALGGMTGRLGAAAMADAIGMRPALFCVGAMSSLCAVVLWWFLPTSRRAPPGDEQPASLLADLAALVADPGVRRLLGMAFLMLGGMLCVYNYAGFRLMAPPFGLSQTAVSALFSTYLAGIVASVCAGRLADRLGRGRVLWMFVLVALIGDLLTLSQYLPVFAIGVVLLTVGYFASATVAASWIVNRVPPARSSASAVYMLTLYSGSSVFGTSAGWAFQAAGWGGLVALLVVMHVTALAFALSLGRMRPVPARATAGGRFAH